MKVLPKLTVLGLALTGAMAQAIPPIPEQSGWSGHINLGVGAGSSESNMLGGIGSIDLGQDKISSLDESPGSEDLVMPAVNFEVAYTLAHTRTQFHLGSHMADTISFDQDSSIETHLGVRQQLEEIGTFGIALVTSPLATDVWKDPYVVGEKRGDTERTSLGTHLAWDNIFGTPLEVDWTAKEIDLDDERSGEALGLSRADQRLLDRTGNVYRFNVRYHWQINERNQLVPRIGYLDFDLDGGAMEQDGATVGLDYIYKRDHWRIVSKLSYQDLESSSRNPIYDDKRQVETVGASVTAFYARPFGLKNWTANATAAYTDGDSNIDFYDSTFGLVSIGMLYRFD